MAKKCELRRANDLGDAACAEEECIYWRVAGHLGLAETEAGCAIQHFQLLEGREELAEWLLSVKQRLEQEQSG